MANPMTLERGAGIATSKGPSLRVRMRRGIWGYIFVSPWILIYTAFGLYPLLLSFYLTFFTASATGVGSFRLVGVVDCRIVSDSVAIERPWKAFS